MANAAKALTAAVTGAVMYLVIAPPIADNFSTLTLPRAEIFLSVSLSSLFSFATSASVYWTARCNLLNSCSLIAPILTASLASSSCFFCSSSFFLVVSRMLLSFSCFCFHRSTLEESYFKFLLIAARSRCCSFKSELRDLIEASSSVVSSPSLIFRPLIASAISLTSLT